MSSENQNPGIEETIKNFLYNYPAKRKPLEAWLNYYTDKGFSQSEALMKAFLEVAPKSGSESQLPPIETTPKPQPQPLTTQRKPYNRNTAYGRKKLREQAAQYFEGLSPTEKNRYNAFGFIATLLIVGIILLLLYIFGGDRAVMQWLHR